MSRVFGVSERVGPHSLCLPFHITPHSVELWGFPLQIHCTPTGRVTLRPAESISGAEWLTMTCMVSMVLGLGS